MSRSGQGQVENRLHLSERLALRPAEAAKVLGVSEGHLRNLLPELPHVRLGGRLVIPVDGLRKWLQERTEAQVGRIDGAVDEIMRSFSTSDND